MNSPLDDLEHVGRVDPRGMLDIITALPESAEDALETAEKVNLKIRRFRSLVVAGMGGSAVGGLLLRDWLQQTSPVPIVVSRDYGLPGFVGRDTLLFAVSYSGGTEETLSAYEEARQRGAKIVAFTSGGELEKRARASRLTIYRLPTGFQPRAAIAHQFFTLAVAARKAGIAGDCWWEVKEAIDTLKVLREEMRPDVPTKSNPAKRLAEDIKGYTPIVYGSHIHEAVAYRWNTQLNENGKSPAASSFIPEAFHNATVASEGDPAVLRHLCAVFLTDPMDGERLAAKTRRFMELLRPGFGKILEVQARGEGRLARMLSSLYVGDYASAYLGVLYGKDPSTVESIDRLKRG
ncbi:MAG: bifunctional phosphoglucose/phosphomannose isomerase [Candidatus Bathyarchaeota archaeon]|nr:bifunctional phosphoglucose/phosphomannose isomerase [Candidatus Bathyarchaeota archaeon]